MVTVTGGNTRMVRGKDKEHSRVLMETDTSGNSVMVSDTGMEYTYLQRKETYITENTNRIREMDKDITGGQMAMNTAETGRIT